MIGVPPVSVSIIGGGGKVSLWCQMLSNVLNRQITVYPASDTLPARAVASAAMIGEGALRDYEPFLQALRREQRNTVFLPDPESAAAYEALYSQYLRLYQVSRMWHHPG